MASWMEYTQRQSLLESEQIKTYNYLAKVDESEGRTNSPDVITAIVSSIINAGQCTTTVFVVEGVAFMEQRKKREKKLKTSTLELKACEGWMVTSRFFTSPQIKSKLQQHKQFLLGQNPQNSRRLNGLPCFGILNCLNDGSKVLDIKGAFRDHLQDLRVTSESAESLSCSKGSQLILNMETEGTSLEQSIIMMGDDKVYRHVSSDSDPTFSSIQSCIVSAVEDGATLKTSQDCCGLTLSVHRLRSVLKLSKNGNIHFNQHEGLRMFSMVFKGLSPNVEVPEDFIYNDPLFSWESQKQTMGTPSLLAHIEASWTTDPQNCGASKQMRASDSGLDFYTQPNKGKNPNGMIAKDGCSNYLEYRNGNNHYLEAQPFASKTHLTVDTSIEKRVQDRVDEYPMAEFCLFNINNFKSCEPLGLEFKNGMVRNNKTIRDDTGKCRDYMEIWAHGPRPICQEGHSSTSSSYSTFGISASFLPIPNQLGQMDGHTCLLHGKENGAHWKIAKTNDDAPIESD